MLAPDSLVWKLAGRVQAASAGNAPQADHTFVISDLPVLFDQILVQLQDFPTVPEQYRPQENEPQIDNENLSEGNTRDGMDIVFCKFNLKTKRGSYCGAGRPLLLVRDGELVEFKKGLDAIGYCSSKEKIFETVQFDLQKGDQFYLFSDGYTDQFGGENVKKFNRERFKNLLISLDGMNFQKQKNELIFSYNNWKGKQEQIDDVCVIGVKI